ncbi:MAG: bifunctional folylpolyglutamate synthase/dihydrofolate synthase [Deltaproteobacteria bacterium]|nr:bifunctional folylpolyglutamate synthase/dihydrofolate synthase [Deltaproteobacteria bacterium]
MTISYQDTLAWLYRLEARRGMDFRLERLAPVLASLGEPQRALRCVHVAGTNGKGSTAAMIESAMRRGGYLTGLYTSPHLLSFRERIRVGGEPIAASAVVAQVGAVRAAMQAARAELTFFEIATLAALLEFRDRHVDVAVLETGLGGRLDATNVVGAKVAVLTSIGIDHREFLGDTIEQIAFEKAGIVAPGATLVSGPLPEAAHAVVAERVREQRAHWLRFGRDFFDLPAAVEAQRRGDGLLGAHQLSNAAIAAAAVDALADELPVARDVRDLAIVEARWPGRLEIINGRPPVILDAAHNPQAAEALAAALDAFDACRPALRAAPRVLVFAAMADKDWPAMLRSLLPRFDAVVFSRLPMARAEQPERFVAEFCSGAARGPESGLMGDPVQVADSPEAALAQARGLAASGGSVVVAGSIFLLGHLYRAAGGKLLEQDLSD